MGSIATEIEEQLKLLKDRGLIINDDEKAKEILLDIGYYRLGFYWFYFQDEESHNFEEDIDLDEIVELYYFDFDIKMLLLRYIYRIEVHFRTQLVYHVSNYYKSNNCWYSDPKIVNSVILKEFNEIYEQVIAIAKIARKFLSANKTKADQFSYAKIIKALNAPPRNNPPTPPPTS